MEKIILYVLSIFFVAAIAAGGCLHKRNRNNYQPFVSEVVHPEWSKDAVLYEVNIRQFTPEGTFNAFTRHLPRLKELGVDILWLMPIHPIGIKNRKDELGSYYSVRDYMKVNPEFGTLEDFKILLDKAHEAGFHVIMDWVPNHSSWDNSLTTEHPEFYVKDKDGNFIPPLGTDWTDVIQFDWTNKGLHEYMLNALKFWVELGVDGFRVDHPHKTPPEFWETVRAELWKIKPVLLLAENEGQNEFLKKGFDMNYSWELHHLMNQIARKKDSVNSLEKYYEKELFVYPQNTYRMVFLDNHDENSWNGTITSRMGEAQYPFAVFMFTTRGVPLLYNGQEVCLNKSLRFFTKDTIRWDTCTMTAFYKKLIRLKKENQALWNGEEGGKMEIIKTNQPGKVFAFSREKDGNLLIVFLNLRDKEVALKPVLKNIRGTFTDYFNHSVIEMPDDKPLIIEPWGFRIFIK